MQELKRDEKIIVFPRGDNKYAILDFNGGLLVGYEKDFAIYMKNVMFRRDGKMQGIYLGDLKENDPLLSVSDKKKVEIVDGKFVSNGKIVKTGRMVTISNKNDVFIII